MSTQPSMPRPRAALEESGFEDLLSEVLERVRATRDEQARWRLLLDAVVTMAADLSLDALLSRIVQIACDLAGARYAALGVLSARNDRPLRTFVTHGLTPEQIAGIGDLPVGHGILGLIIDHPEPLRLRDLGEHPRSFGFPEHHPPMHSFLGVPVAIGDKVFGNLYLTEKLDGGEFTEQDERIVVALAAAAGVAIENARLHEEAGRRERWLAATAEITARLAEETGSDEALQLIADRARWAAESDVAWIVTGPQEQLRLAALCGGSGETGPTSQTAAALASTTMRTGVPAVVEDLAGEGTGERHGSPAALGPALLVPLQIDRVPGVLAVAWTRANAEHAADVDLALPGTFAEQAALAVHVARTRADRQRLAVYEDRDRIGRDLHDIVIQRLFAIGLGLQGALRRVDDPDLTARLDRAVEEIDDTIKDIRRTIFELGAMSRSDDLQSEVTQLVERAAGAMKVRPTLAFEGPVRLRIPEDVGRDLVAVLAEALANAARHAEATEVGVLVSAGSEALLRVTDNGRGIGSDVVESGLANMRRRAEKYGGQCRVAPGEAAGTVVEWSVPLG